MRPRGKKSQQGHNQTSSRLGDGRNAAAAGQRVALTIQIRVVGVAQGVVYAQTIAGDVANLIQSALQIQIIDINRTAGNRIGIEERQRPAGGEGWLPLPVDDLSS